MRRALTVAVALVAALTAAGAILYTRNSTPIVPTIAAADAAAAGSPREVVAWINGSRDFTDYRAAIDAALTAAEGSR